MSHIKNPRLLKRKSHAVELHNDWMVIKLFFDNKHDAMAFCWAAKKSKSVTGVVLLTNGKFDGALDGEGN